MKLKKIFAGMSALAIAATMSMAVSAADAEQNVDTDKFNLILITTDIPCEVNDEDQAVIDGNVVTCKDVTLSMDGNTYTFETVGQKTDAKYLTFEVINAYNDDLAKFDYTMPDDGTIDIDFTLEGVDGVTGNAGVSFQTGNYTYRDAFGTDHSKDPEDATFPNAIVGVQGGGYGYDTAVACSDTAIDGNGSYSISIAASGTINSNAQVLDEETGISRNGDKWSCKTTYAHVEETSSNTDSNTSGTDSKTDSNTSGTDSKADTSSKKDTTTSKSNNTTTTSKANSTAATSSTASDNTNSATGATAGIALAGIALAGAAIVVSKRK